METSETSMGTRSMATAQLGQPMVSIVVPAFNEAVRIGVSLRKIDEFMRDSSMTYELIVVDDGSTDETSAVINQSRVNALKLIRNDRNHGKGYTVRQGVLAATGNYVLFTDADLSAPIEELSKLIDVALNEGADIVIGSRAVDRSYIEKHQSRFRELGGIAFNFMVRSILGLQLHDTQCGFKLFHRQKSRRIFERVTTYGFGFDPELLFMAKRQGLRIREVPVRWSHSEGSKVRFMRHATVMFLDLLRIRWNALTGKY
jgi:glycosyltransferase involved in cell wall biosynthesis